MSQKRNSDVALDIPSTATAGGPKRRRPAITPKARTAAVQLNTRVPSTSKDGDGYTVIQKKNCQHWPNNKERVPDQCSSCTERATTSGGCRFRFRRVFRETDVDPITGSQNFGLWNRIPLFFDREIDSKMGSVFDL
jgi:hypothetical protein